MRTCFILSFQLFHNFQIPQPQVMKQEVRETSSYGYQTHYSKWFSSSHGADEDASNKTSASST